MPSSSAGSEIPERWLSSCSRVTVSVRPTPKPGSASPSEAASASFPNSTCRMTVSALIGLVTEKSAKWSSAVACLPPSDPKATMSSMPWLEATPRTAAGTRLWSTCLRAQSAAGPVSTMVVYAFVRGGLCIEHIVRRGNGAGTLRAKLHETENRPPHNIERDR